MNMLIAAVVLLFAASHVVLAGAGGVGVVSDEFTLEWRQFVNNPHSPQPVIRIGDAQFNLRAIPKDKPKDPMWLALFGDDEKNHSKTVFHPGKWYHLALVGRGGKLKLFVNGFVDDGFSGAAPTGDVSVSEPPGAVTKMEGLKLSKSALQAGEILARFKSAIPSAKPILTIAHRGVHKHAPENTRVSYVQAIAAGAPILEFDTALTSDGHIVGMHDKTVDRTTDGAGKLAEMTLEQVRKLDAGSWKKPEYNGEPVPTLDEIAEVARSGKAILMLDLKAEGQGAAITKWLETSNYPHEMLMLAPWTDEEAMALRNHVPATVPMIRLTSKLPTGTIDDEYFAKAKSLGLSGFSVNWQHLTQSFVQGAQRSGMKVYTWTINDPSDIAGAALLGVDGVITDDPAATIRLLSELMEK